MTRRCRLLLLCLATATSTSWAADTDGDPTDAASGSAAGWTLGGRVRLDAGAADAADTSWTRLREAQGEFIAEPGGGLKLRVQYDFAPRGGWGNSYAELRPAPKFVLRIGNQLSGVGFDDSSGGGSSPFLERPLTSSLAAGRRLGAQLQTWDERWGVRVGVFDREDFDGDADRRGARRPEAIGRFIWRPWTADGDRLAIGASVARTLDDDPFELRLRGSAETRHAALNVAGTGRILDARALRTLAAEVVLYRGPVLLAAEAMQLQIERDAAAHLRQRAWYVGGSWLAGNARRRYRLGSASVGAVEPRTPGGAAELTFRLARLTLQRPDGLSERQINAVTGLTWHLNSDARLVFESARTSTRSAAGPRTSERTAQLRLHFNIGHSDSD